MGKHKVTKDVELAIKQIVKNLIDVPMYTKLSSGQLKFMDEKVVMKGENILASKTQVNSDSEILPGNYYIVTRRKTVNHKRRLIKAYEDNGEQGLKDYMVRTRKDLDTLIEFDNRTQAKQTQPNPNETGSEDNGPAPSGSS